MAELKSKTNLNDAVIAAAVLVLLFFVATGSGCVTKPALANQATSQSPPALVVKTWAGSSANQAIRRSQDKAQILCSDPRFDGYVAMTYEDFDCIVDTFVHACTAWQPALSNCLAPKGD